MSTRYSLRELALSPGQSKHEELQVELRPYRQGGFAYEPSRQPTPARLDIDGMTQGLSFRLRFHTELHGPCARCLEDAVVPMDIDAREVHDPDGGSAELACEFVTDDDHLDVTAWAQDVVGLDFPHRVLCKEHCKGLCAQCGTNLNEANCDCTVVTTDPRWEKLRELQTGE